MRLPALSPVALSSLLFSSGLSLPNGPVEAPSSPSLANGREEYTKQLRLQVPSFIRWKARAPEPRNLQEPPPPPPPPSVSTENPSANTLSSLSFVPASGQPTVSPPSAATAAASTAFLPPPPWANSTSTTKFSSFGTITPLSLTNTSLSYFPTRESSSLETTNTSSTGTGTDDPLTRTRSTWRPVTSLVEPTSSGKKETHRTGFPGKSSSATASNIRITATSM